MTCRGRRRADALSCGCQDVTESCSVGDGTGSFNSWRSWSSSK